MASVSAAGWVKDWRERGQRGDSVGSTAAWRLGRTLVFIPSEVGAVKVSERRGTT